MEQRTGSGLGPRLIGGRYEVLQELGRGGMGIVWHARDRVIGREVAIKELQLPASVSPAERTVSEQRVLREARTAGRLTDPAVVTVHDVLTESGTTYIVMELVRAPTLSELIARRGPVSPSHAAELVRQVLPALEEAHAAGIVHRDIKPSNIMVSDGRIKLTDFGIAHAVDDPRLTTSGAVVGSPSFMAPERIRGADAAPAGDMWSLGVTLFFALEGWIPFDRQTTAATLNAVLNEPPRLSGSYGALGSVVTGLLINDPRARFTAAQVRTLLDRVPDGAEQNTRPVATSTPVGDAGTRSRRFRRGRLIAAAVAGVALFAGGAATAAFFLAGEGDPSAMDDTLLIGAGGDIDTFELDNGECGSGRVAAGARLREDVSCSDPHDFEVFAERPVLDTFRGEDVAYPGRELLRRRGDAYCSVYFASDKVTAPAKQTSLRYVALVPSQQAWEAARQATTSEDPGFQSVYCVLYGADGRPLRTTAAD